MKRAPNQRVLVPVLGASARAEIADDKDRAGSRTYIKALRLAAYFCSPDESGWRPFHFPELSRVAQVVA